MDNIDIYQLDPERQVLFILKENKANDPLSVEAIKEKLIAHRISPNTTDMRVLLLHTLRDPRRKLIKDGLVFKNEGKYQIMQKGIEYLKSTVIVINPLEEKSAQETIGNILSKLSGHIKLCDPYFDDVAYNLLKLHLDSPKIKSIKIIYGNNRIDSTKKYRLGNNSVELKKKKNVHDRFVIDDKTLYFFGASMNHIGNKLSFIVNLTVYRDKFDDIFQNYWNAS